MDNLQTMTVAPVTQALLKVGAQHRERHVAEARQQQRLRILERLVERGVHGLLDKTAGRFRSVSEGEQRRLAERLIDVAQRNRREVAGEGPSTAMSFLRSHMAVISKPGHDPP